MPMRSGITRWSICPSVSSVWISGPRPWRRERPPFERSSVSLSLQAWKLVMTIFARHALAALVVAVGVVRLEHPEPVADGEPGGDHQEPARELPAVGASDRVD